VDDGPQQGAQSVPQNLNSDTHEDERGQADDDIHRRVTERTPDPFRETVTQVDRRRNQRRAQQHSHDQRPAPFRAFGPIRADRNRDGDRARPHGQGQCERIERLAGIIRLMTFFRIPRFAGRIIVRLTQERPAGGDDDESASHLHHRERDSEKGENMSADEDRREDQHQAIKRDHARERDSSLGRQAACQRQEDRRIADGVYDRKQRSENQKRIFYEVAECGRHRFCYDLLS
jgi:hypothetical protein